MKKIKLLLPLLLMTLLFSCGKGIVEVDNDSFEYKIVVEGFLEPGKKVSKIRINRNFRINENLRNASLIPEVSRTNVTITDLESDNTYDLEFFDAGTNRLEDYYWQYNGDDLDIDYGKSYRLDVSTDIHRKTLTASAVTTVPEKGFDIVGINHESLTYRQKNEDGEIMNFEMTIERSPGVNFYLTTLKALNPQNSEFIFDNPWEEVKFEDADSVDWGYEYDWIQNTPKTAGQQDFEIFWNDIWYYGGYQIIVYAVDENYKEFLQTYNNVQEDDGNFHEPRFSIEGDGIGIFGSVISDSVHINILEE